MQSVGGTHVPGLKTEGEELGGKGWGNPFSLAVSQGMGTLVLKP